MISLILVSLLFAVGRAHEITFYTGFNQDGTSQTFDSSVNCLVDYGANDIYNSYTATGGCWEVYEHCPLGQGESIFVNVGSGDLGAFSSWYMMSSFEPVACPVGMSPCLPGSAENSAGDCEICAADKYSDSGSACIDCPSGHSSAAGATSADDCILNLIGDDVLEFAGGNVDDYVLVDVAEADFDEFSAATWFKVDDSTSSSHYFISYAVSGENNEFLVGEQNGGVSVYIGGSSSLYSGDNTIKIGEFNHVAVVWSSASGDAELYLNGVSVDSETGIHSGSALGGTGGFVLGQDQDIVGGNFDASQAFIGDLYGAYLWNRVLSADEVAALASFPCDHAGDALVDYSAIGHDGVHGGVVYISGPMEECATEPLESLLNRQCYKHDYDFYGADLGSSGGIASFADCLQLCRDTSGCVSVTYRESDDTCWPKNKVNGDVPGDQAGLTSANLGCVDGLSSGYSSYCQLIVADSGYCVGVKSGMAVNEVCSLADESQYWQFGNKMQNKADSANCLTATGWEDYLLSYGGANEWSYYDPDYLSGHDVWRFIARENSTNCVDVRGDAPTQVADVGVWFCESYNDNWWGVSDQYFTIGECMQ